jgi:putative ABC transport system ATP-binding protein
LLNLIGCLDDPDTGRIVLDGQDLALLNDEGKSRLRNRKIGFIFQSFNLVPVLSVQENVELPLLLHDDLSAGQRAERVRQALQDVELLGFARQLVTAPALVLADEPTANLDSQTTTRLVDLMVELNARRGVTFLFSTHDEKLMGRVARVVRIRDGQIVAT